MTARVERILDKLTRRQAPHLVPNRWDQLPGSSIQKVQKIARRLADYDVVVIVGQLPDDLMPMKDLHIQDWVRSHHQFYNLLAKQLFPSYSGFKAYFADMRMPPVVVLEGEAVPVMNILAGYVTPYVSIRQAQGNATMLEIQALMDEILTELAADDLNYEDYVTLRQGGVNLIRQMLRATVQHISLTLLDKPILDQVEPICLQEPAAPPRPATMPEEERLKTPNTDAGDQQLQQELELLPEDDQPTPATNEMFLYNIVTRNKDGRKPARPPLPEIPRQPRRDEDR